MTNIAIIGAGAMGGAIATGLLRAGLDPASLHIANRSSSRLTPFAAVGADVSTDNSAMARRADVVILAVKPWLTEDVARSLAATVDMTGKTVISVAAGISPAEIAQWVGEGAVVATAIPNTAAALCQSITFITPPDGCEAPALALQVFKQVGTVMVVDETHLPACMALASCGIAYAMRYVRAAMEGGVELGLRAADAQKIICHTLQGAAALLLLPGAHPESEIDKVTTPGGLTIRGLNAMEDAGFSPAVIAGLRACLNK